MQRHVFFKQSQTWWTLLTDNAIINELDGDNGIRTSSRATVTPRGGVNGDFGYPKKLPENTATGMRLAVFVARCLAGFGGNSAALTALGNYVRKPTGVHLPSSSSSSPSPSPTAPRGDGRVRHHHRPERRRFSERHHPRHHRPDRRHSVRHHHTPSHGAAGAGRNFTRRQERRPRNTRRCRGRSKGPIFTSALRQQEVRARTNSTAARDRTRDTPSRAAQQTTVADTIAALQRQLLEQKNQLQEQKQLIAKMQYPKRRKRSMYINEPCKNKTNGCPCTSRMRSHGYCCPACAKGETCTANFHSFDTIMEEGAM